MSTKKGMSAAQFLALLQKVLPKATQNPGLASTIYQEVEKEVRLFNSIESFEKFCEKGSLPDLQPETVEEFQSQLATNFGPESVTVAPDEEGKALEVEITLPDRTVNRRVVVAPPGSEEEEVKAPMVPFPVSLPTDPGLVWVLARRENFGPDEAGRALAAIEEEFWATKAGQKLLKEGVERSFAEFIAHVPASALADSGLKRHYKEPETLCTLRLLPPQNAPEPAYVPKLSDIIGEPAKREDAPPF